MEIEIKKIGNSLGVILPKELLTKANLEQGDKLMASANMDGLKLSPYDENVQRQLEVARKIMKKDKNILRELAGR